MKIDPAYNYLLSLKSYRVYIMKIITTTTQTCLTVKIQQKDSDITLDSGSSTSIDL